MWRAVLMASVLGTAHGAAVIFDLGGVLFSYHKRDVAAALMGARATSPFKPLQGIALVRRCRAQLDAQGKRKHQLYVLSNFSRDAFNVLKRFHQPVLDLFDGIVLSCDVGYAKPDPRIYRHVLATYRLNARDCIFIDDEAVKAHAAIAVGMRGLVYHSHACVTQQLQHLHIF